MKKLLWTPSEEFKNQSEMKKFLGFVNKRTGGSYKEYPELYRWSVSEPTEFWSLLWNYLDIICEKPYDAVAENADRFIEARWFVGAKLNYAENMLRFCDTDEPMIIFRGEDEHRSVLSGRELRRQVLSLAQALKNDGIRAGDTVAAYMPNIPQTVIAMLAAAAVGAVWCSCATDIGSGAAIDRLGQVEPKLLFTADGYRYKGKAFDVTKNAAAVAKGISSIKKTVVAHYAGDPLAYKSIDNAVAFDEYLADEGGFTFEQLPASHPLVVMFSSGTTGKPKCMVQSAAGLLLNQLKEVRVHSDIKRGDRLLYITTCSWMMWNWQLAALGAGACVVLYDGNPSYPDTGAIWRILEQERVTVFGLSASYIHALLHEGFSPKDTVDLSALKEISQTGSALSEDGFDYIYTQIKSDLFFSSIAGGTDINGCFAIANPLSPVYSNELQAAGLGMKINCYDDSGKPILDREGELVCEAPAPSMPLYFWNDPDNKRYFDAYFGVFEGVWRHGDYVQLHSDTGGISFKGRSDSVLKPSGVRIGTAEIYNIVERLSEVTDSLAIGQTYDGDQRVLLFVHLADGFSLDDALTTKIKTALRTGASPRHVPARIIAVSDIPKTLNGKKVESAVTNIVNGRAVTNRDALMNPDSLDEFTALLTGLQ